MTQKLNVLTGVKPTGDPHIGNYLGAIKPALELANSATGESLFFIADYHALTATQEAKEFKDQTYEVAATWIACGLDPKKTIFYRQSDVPEIFELSWILSCFTPKGLMNRAHAYKAKVAENEAAKKSDLDAGINMGVYTYPILMASDILTFNTHLVPVGEDQIQHVEIARDIADKFNNNYGKILTLPKHVVQKETAAILGIDGRKMSKSYGNGIPLFAKPEQLKSLISKFKTDSTPPDQPKDPVASALFTIYSGFGDPDQIQKMRDRYASGIGWGEVKKELIELLTHKMERPREIYYDLIAHREKVDQLLAEGAKRARAIAIPLLSNVRKAIGRD